MITGSMSATTSQPASIAQARQATRRRRMLTTTTAAVAPSAIHWNSLGAAASAYQCWGRASQCHGPPRAAGSSEAFNSPEANVVTDWYDPGACGLTNDVWRADASTAE